MAEQKATAKFLHDHEAVNLFLQHIKEQVHLRLKGLYDGFMELKKAGFPVDAIQPQAAIYLTIQIDLKGRKNKEGVELSTQEDVTNYLLNKARLAMVPFGFFGAERESNWYRISVGCCKKEEIPEVINSLKSALSDFV
jgi:aspartate aminotransferase